MIAFPPTITRDNDVRLPAQPLKAYESVGLDAAVATASPHRLILMLFEGAKQALVIARSGMEEKTSRKGMAISKAIDIILNGLRVSLNMEEGGTPSQDLYALYDYMARRRCMPTCATILLPSTKSASCSAKSILPGSRSASRSTEKIWIAPQPM